MNETTYYRRRRDFHDIQDLVDNNPIVGRFVTMYSHGVIITKEETLLQIVKELAKSRETIMEQLKNEAMWM